MKALFLAATFSLALISAASASGIVFDLPNLDFPPTDSETVDKDCLSYDATSGTCLVQE